MDLVDTGLRAVVLPAAVASVVALLWLRPWRRDERPASQAATPFAVAAGYAAALVAVFGWPGLPPQDATQWVELFALLAVGVTVATAGRPKLRWSGAGVLGLGLGTALVLPVSHAMSGGEIVLLILLVAASVLAIDVALSRLARDAAPRPHLLGVTMFVALTAALVVLGGSASLGQRLGAAAAALGALFALGLKWPEVASLRAAGAVLGVAIAGTAWAGFLYAELPAWMVASVVVAPGLAFGLHPLVTRARGAAVRAVLAVSTMVLPASAVVAVAAADYLAEVDASASGAPGDDAGDDDADYGYD